MLQGWQVTIGLGGEGGQTAIGMRGEHSRATIKHAWKAIRRREKRALDGNVHEDRKKGKSNIRSQFSCLYECFKSDMWRDLILLCIGESDSGENHSFPSL